MRTTTKAKASTKELMASTLPKNTGSMRVHNSEAYQALMEGIAPEDVHGANNNTTMNASFEGMDDNLGSPSRNTKFLVLHEAVASPSKSYNGGAIKRKKRTSKLQTQIDNARSRRETRYRQSCKEVEQETRRMLQDAKRIEEIKFAKKYNKLMKEREEYLPHVDKLIHHHDEEYLFNLATLHEDWHEKVFNPIQDQISKKVNETSIEDIRARHRRMYDAYLTADNAKESGVFRDVIIEEEYDPLESHKHTVKYRKPAKSANPQRHAENKRRLEFTERTLIATEDEKELMKQKRVRNRARADMMPISQYSCAEDTPAGRYSHQNKKTYAAPTDRKTKSQVPLTQYDMVKGAQANALVNKEFGPGKRTFASKLNPKSLVQLSEGHQKSVSKPDGKRVKGYRGQVSTLKI